MSDYTKPELIKGMKLVEPPLTSNVSGYGGKLPTRFMVQYANNQWKRVYMMQYGNAGSAYIIVNWQDMFLDSDTEHSLMAFAASS